VPFKGGAPAITALLSGDVQMYFASLSVGRGQLQSGKLKALATTSAVRLASLPDLPTTVEAGFPNYQVMNWWALAAPKGTPAANLDWIRREFTEAMRNPDVVKRFSDLGFVIVGGTSAEFEERVRRESAMYEKLVKSRKLTAQ
jgi:tripartite-type tricarboxylate transporter receptor subunit TctC